MALDGNSTKSRAKPLISTVASITTLVDALSVLRDSPSAYDLSEVITFLVTNPDSRSTVEASQVVNLLVAKIIPVWWHALEADSELSSTRDGLVDYLCDIASVNLLVSRLKQLVTEARNSSTTNHAAPGNEIPIQLNVLDNVLSGDEVLNQLLRRSGKFSTPTRQETDRKDIVSLLSSGRLIALVAEAEDTQKSSSQDRPRSWIGHGSDYCAWLARNLGTTLMNHDNVAISVPVAAQTFGKALMLGYQDNLLASLLEVLPPSKELSVPSLVALMDSLPAYQQRNFLLALLAYLDIHALNKSLTDSATPIDLGNTAIGNCAALIKAVINNNVPLLDSMSDLCVNVETSICTRSFNLRRLSFAVLGSDEDRSSSMMERMMNKFGDQLFIKHATISQQEALAQMILLVAGRMHRAQPMSLFTVAKSSIQTHSTSNRLKASSQRAQWLGMIVAMALSNLTDKPASRLKFDDDSMRTPEAEWYMRLVHVQDCIGNYQDVKLKSAPHKKAVVVKHAQKGFTKTSASNRLQNKETAGQRSSKIISRIVEIEGSDDDEEDDDIVPYTKPDSDPEDEEDDPTLVERNKPRVPVYIRDLLIGLRESENYDRHRLALETASSLVRRKATFGKEVQDHAEELLAILLNLNDTFEMDDFLELRQEALISLLVAQPQIIAPAIAHSSLSGDFSVQQRAAMLTAVALGARELSGHKDIDRPEAPKFPSKRVPKHLQQVYGEGSPSKFEAASQQLEQSMVQPLALTAADKLSGPNVLKVRSFSSRMDVQKKATKLAPNALAKHVAEWFFLPLINGWWLQKQSFGNRAVVFSKHLLPLYLRTLAVLLHASGPSTFALPQLTTELWDILLSLRINALRENDVRTLDSLLFAFLTLLELNEDKQRLANDHAKELVETQEWAKLVLDHYGSESSSEQTEGGKIKMLAAAVVVKCHEIVERWQRLMMGSMVDL